MSDYDFTDEESVLHLFEAAVMYDVDHLKEAASFVMLYDLSRFVSKKKTKKKNLK